MSHPPVAAQRPTVRTHHGDTFIDPYEWLRDKDDPHTLAYLQAENDWAKQRTAHLDDLRNTIVTEIRSRTQETDLSLPVRRGNWWYYTRTVEGLQYGIHCRCPITDPADFTPPQLKPGVAVDGEQVLLDSNVEAADSEFFSLGAFSLSDDGRYLAWSVDVVGDERYDLRIKDLSTGELLADRIEGIGTGATWSAGARHLFYSRLDDAWRPFEIWRHELGTDPAHDVLVHAEPDERFFTGIGRTASDRYLVIGSASKLTSEHRVLAADQPTGEFGVVWPRREGIEYSLEHAQFGDRDVFLILHNEAAEDFELVAVGAEGPYTDQQVLIGHQPGVRLEDIDVFRNHVALSYRESGLARISILPVGNDGLGQAREIDFGEELFTAGVGANAEWDQPVIRVGVTSLVRPMTLFDYDVRTDELIERKRQIVLGDYKPEDYEQHRCWAAASDGTQIPISLVCRRGTPRDASAPALLYGYGSYEISVDPTFSISRLSLLDRGFVFAIAHVRGGGELGRAWYEQGKLLAKRNTFTDFVAAADALVEQGWTSPERLLAEGGSAGGLLMGAVANIAAAKFAGIVAAVPFVDNLTTILDPSLPLTVTEWEEWGNPLADPEVYAYMRSYAPYENVAAQDYPAILAVTSLNDTRVSYAEPAKWVAMLRATATGGDILLKTELNAGHGGVSGRYQAWQERAWELAWIIDRATTGPIRLPADGTART